MITARRLLANFLLIENWPGRTKSGEFRLLKAVKTTVLASIIAATSTAATSTAATSITKTKKPTTDHFASKHEPSNTQIRNGFWSFGLSAVRHTLKAGDGNELLGNAVKISIGTGYIQKKWYSYGSFDLLMGPFEPAREKQLDIDSQGTGATYWWGYSAQELDLRSPEGGYGFAMGFEYSDSISKSIGRNRKQVGASDNVDNIDLINDFSLRISTFAITPSIFFCWLDPGRPSGNSPELLKTRVEGYILTLGISIPLHSTYHARFNRKIIEEGVGLGGVIDDAQREKGRMEGFSLLINFTSFLGV